MEQPTPSQQHPILLFDGVCNLCHGFVIWLIKRDKKGVFKYASLQSDFGKKKMHDLQLNKGELDTVVLLQGKQVFTHSDVALEVVRILGGAWSLLYVFKLIPKVLRDYLYNGVARNRYRWFGKKDACMMPTPDLKSRFLE